MTFQSRIPIPVDSSPARSLRKARSEGCLKGTPELKLHHLRSMGQLSPPPDEPLPPLPLQSSSISSIQVRSIDGVIASIGRSANTHQPSVSNRSSYSGSSDSQNLESVTGSSSPRNTMLIHEHTDQERIEFQLRSDSRKTPNLHNLGRLLELSTRLKEVGTSFTRNGEMRTYGYPPLDEDIQQMLHLGVEYDDLWHAFFTGRTPEVEHNLWPVLRVLKKMLQNERVAFDDRHTRLNYGYGVSRIIRLSDQYDLLREEWFQKTLGDIHPALRWHNLSVRVEIRKTPAVVGWSFIRDQNSIARKKSRQAKYLTIIAEKQPSIHNGPSLTEQEADIAYRSPLDTREAAVSSSTSMPTPAYTAAVGRPHELTTAAPVLIHDSSPLHCANTASMLLAGNYFETHTASDAHKILQRPGSRQHEHGGVLGLLVEDERRRAEERPWHAEGQQRANVQAVEEEKVTSGKIGKKSHGFKKWLRSIFENSELAQSMDRAGRNVLGDL